MVLYLWCLAAGVMLTHFVLVIKTLLLALLHLLSYHLNYNSTKFFSVWKKLTWDSPVSCPNNELTWFSVNLISRIRKANWKRFIHHIVCLQCKKRHVKTMCHILCSFLSSKHIKALAVEFLWGADPLGSCVMQGGACVDRLDSLHPGDA